LGITGETPILAWAPGPVGAQLTAMNMGEGWMGRWVKDWTRSLAIVLVLTLGLGGASGAFAKAPRPIEVRVVIVTTWEAYKDGVDQLGELHAWQTRWLKTALPFPTGLHALQYDPDTHVLALLTGMATARAAASVMALGSDPRFDLTHAYWIVAGTAGVDPKVASAGSAAWARFVVDGDLMQELDPRDAPAEWPTGAVPNGKIRPYETPRPPVFNDDGNMAYALNRKLVDWAYQTSKGTSLLDDDATQALRAPYSGPGGRPPIVLEGDGLMSARFWYGDRMNDWARRWVDYWTDGKGQFVMSAEEDTGILQALTFLSRPKKVDLSRVLVLRAASDYTLAPPGVTAAAFLEMENAQNFPGTPGALENLYRVAGPVARALAEDWGHTRDHVPEPKP
jgi:purine nucleoside permease